MEDSVQLVELRREKRFFELLPRDLLDYLCDHLSIKDQFRFARVCKLAHSSVYERPNPQALKDTPWLIGQSDSSSSSLCETIYDDQVTCYQIGNIPFKHAEPDILGYFKGWIYVRYACSDLIQLVNLFVNVYIDLPPLSTMVIPKRECHYLFAQNFALSLCKSMRPIMIAIVDQYGDLALCKINGGTTWKAHHQDEGYYVKATFYHEKLYAIRNNFPMVDIYKVVNDDLRLLPLGVIDYSQVIDVSLFRSFQQVYLVEDSKGDNMVLVMEYQYIGRVFEFDIFKVVRDGDEFKRLDDLEDQILLLGHSYSEIIDVKDCSNSSIFKGNQICFKGIVDVGIYSIRNGTIIWEVLKRGLHCRQWIFPIFITTAECNCKSH